MKFMILVIGMLIMMVIPSMSYAQDGDTLPLANDWYEILQDDDGVHQLYRFAADDGTRTQLTFSQEDVEHYDRVGSDLAFVSGDGVYLNGEKVVTLSRPEIYDPWAATVQLSPFGDELTFSDQTGLSVLNLETGETELLIENTGSVINPDSDPYRRYYRADYTADPDVLIVYVGVWEVNYRATFNRATDTYDEAIFQMENPENGRSALNQVMTLNDGRLLLYSLPAYDGCWRTSCALWVASSADLETVEIVVDGATLVDLEPDVPMYGIWDVVDMDNGVLRVVMNYYGTSADGDYQYVQLIADVNLEDNTATLVIDPMTFDSDELNTNPLKEPEFSADGQFLMGKGDVIVVDEDGGQSEEWAIIQIDLATGERSAFDHVDGMLVNLELAAE